MVVVVLVMMVIVDVFVVVVTIVVVAVVVTAVVVVGMSLEYCTGEDGIGNGRFKEHAAGKRSQG